MVLVYSIIVLIIAALLLGREMGGIARLHFRGGWKAAAAVMGLFGLQAGVVIFVPGQSLLQLITLIVSQLVLIALLLLNRHVPGTKIFMLGIFLNTLVMVANGGWMPVTPETSQYVHPERTIELYSKPPGSKNIILPRSETSLWLLSDIIRITLPWRRNALSFGDILLILGAAQFIFQATSPKKEQLVNIT